MDGGEGRHGERGVGAGGREAVGATGADKGVRGEAVGVEIRDAATITGSLQESERIVGPTEIG